MIGEARARRAAADIVVQLVGRLLNLLLGVFVIVLLTRELGVRGFGEWATIHAICGVAGYIGEFGLEAAAVRRAASATDEDRRSVIGTLLVLRLVLAVPAALASVVAVMLLATSDDMATAGVIVALLAPVAAVTALRVVFQIRVRNDVPVMVMTTNSLLWTGVVVALAVTGRGGLVAFAAALAAVNTLTTALLATVALRTRSVGFMGMRRHSGELLRVGAVLGLGQLLTFAYGRVDQVLVLHYNDERQAGLYGAAYQLLDRAQFLPAVVLTTLLPLLAAAHAVDRERLKRMVVRGFELLALVSLPVFAFSLAAAEPFVVLLFGAEFRDSARVLPILMAAFVLTAFGYLLGNLALVLGTQGRFVGIAVAALVLNVAANVALLPQFGFVAAAWVTLATEVLVTCLAVPITLGRLKVRLPVFRLIRLLFASVLMGAGVWGLSNAGAGIVWLLVAAPPLYVIAVLGLRGVDISELRHTLTREP